MWVPMRLLLAKDLLRLRCWVWGGVRLLVAVPDDCDAGCGWCVAAPLGRTCGT